MESENEKFFEELAAKMAHEESSVPVSEEPEVELAKATAHTRMRIPAKPVPVPETPPAEEEMEGQLTVDVYQTPTEIVVESAIAGVSPEDVDVDVSRDAVTIRGKRHREKRVRDEDYFYQECYWGKFSRSIILPQEVDAEAARASFKNGILTVSLPKLNKDKTKKVHVKPE